MSSTESKAMKVTPEFFQNPYPFFQAARAQAPVLPTQFVEGEDCVFVTGHPEVEAVLKDPRFVREIDQYLPEGERGNWVHKKADQVPQEWSPMIAMQKNWMLMRDGAEHIRLRTPVMKAFTPQVIDRLRPHIEEIANQLLDAMKGRDTVDVIGEYAFPLPCIVIAELLGVPMADREKFKDWSTALIATLDPVSTDEQMNAGARASVELMDYFRGMVQVRRQEPKHDLMSDLVKSEQLSEEEILASCVLLLVAGHETTVNLIGNGLVTLLKHPEQLAMLKADPSLYVNAVEEMLRYEPPVQLTIRFASEPIVLGGQEIPLGRMTYTVLAAANRDPRVFEDPDKFDITRKNANRHLSFVVGSHHCIGANLARVEAQIALRVLIERMSEMELLADQLAWRKSATFRGLLELPMRGKID